jgi:hypothetical protein
VTNFWLQNLRFQMQLVPLLLGGGAASGGQIRLFGGTVPMSPVSPPRLRNSSPHKAAFGAARTLTY